MENPNQLNSNLKTHELKLLHTINALLAEGRSLHLILIEIEYFLRYYDNRYLWTYDGIEASHPKHRANLTEKINACIVRLFNFHNEPEDQFDESKKNFANDIAEMLEGLNNIIKHTQIPLNQLNEYLILFKQIADKLQTHYNRSDADLNNFIAKLDLNIPGNPFDYVSTNEKSLLFNNTVNLKIAPAITVWNKPAIKQDQTVDIKNTISQNSTKELYDRLIQRFERARSYYDKARALYTELKDFESLLILINNQLAIVKPAQSIADSFILELMDVENIEDEMSRLHYFCDAWRNRVEDAKNCLEKVKTRLNLYKNYNFSLIENIIHLSYVLEELTGSSRSSYIEEMRVLCYWLNEKVTTLQKEKMFLLEGILDDFDYRELIKKPECPAINDIINEINGTIQNTEPLNNFSLYDAALNKFCQQREKFEFFVQEIKEFAKAIESFSDKLISAQAQLSLKSDIEILEFFIINPYEKDNLAGQLQNAYKNLTEQIKIIDKQYQLITAAYQKAIMPSSSENKISSSFTMDTDETEQTAFNFTN